MTRAQPPPIPQLCELVTAEYLEMPGLSLTKPQMQRLWRLEAAVCDAVVDALVASRVLRKTPRGTYVAVRAGHNGRQWEDDMDPMRQARITCAVPIFYATSEGQTRRIATILGEMLRSRGIDARAIDLRSSDATDIDWSRVRTSIVGASIHVGRHQRAAATFVRAHAAELNSRPSAFFSVSLSAASTERREVEAARHLAVAFPRALGWDPGHVSCFAGRLAYTKYGFLKRFIMRRIARREGGPTDVSRDHELTKWDEVERFADTVRSFVEKQTRETNAA
jgi:menaquinone-dependent protoporphyrinogen oxidase